MAKLSTEQSDDLVHLLRKHGVVYARMFGSAATDRLGYDSDIDLAVSAPAPLTHEQKMAIMGDVAEAIGRPVDLIDLRTAHGLVFARALAGRELFCDSSAAKGDALYRRISVVAEDLEFARASFAAAQHHGMFR